MTIIKQSEDKAKLFCDVCEKTIITGLDSSDKEFWELPDNWQYVLIEDKPNCIHICPEHKIEFSHFVKKYIEWKKEQEK